MPRTLKAPVTGALVIIIILTVQTGSLRLSDGMSVMELEFELMPVLLPKLYAID